MYKFVLQLFIGVLVGLTSLAQAEEVMGWKCSYKPDQVAWRNGHKYDLVTAYNPSQAAAESAAAVGCGDAQTNCSSLGCTQLKIRSNQYGVWEDPSSPMILRQNQPRIEQIRYRRQQSHAAKGTCYTMAGVCFVAWLDNVTKAECRNQGGGSWASYNNGACVYPLQ